jgi:hypothetical protein
MSQTQQALIGIAVAAIVVAGTVYFFGGGASTIVKFPEAHRLPAEVPAVAGEKI